MAYLTNQISGIQPELWSAMVQVPLYKSLVALEVANMRLSDTLKYADQIHVPYHGDASVQTYTPGTDLSALAQSWTFDTLVVTSYKAVVSYVDDAAGLTVNVDQAREMATEAAYQLRNQIDTDVFKCITGADGFTAADTVDVLGTGSNANPVSAGTANIIQIFAGARKILRNRNVEETGDWCAIVTPKIAADIEIKAASVGFNVADSTLRNGYAGDFMGFQVFISNNLPTGKLTAIAPGAGGVTATGLSATTSVSVYFGKKGTIDVAMLKSPAMEIKDNPLKIGKNLITWTVYGSAVFTKNKSRGINMPIGSAYK